MLYLPTSSVFCFIIVTVTGDNYNHEDLHYATVIVTQVPGVQLKSELYFNISNLLTKIYNMLYYTTNLYLQ